jgi:hypothetical protein
MVAIPALFVLSRGRPGKQRDEAEIGDYKPKHRSVQAASSSGSPGLQHEKDDNRNEYWRYDDARNGKSGIRAAIVLHVCDGAAATEQNFREHTTRSSRVSNQSIGKSLLVLLRELLGGECSKMTPLIISSRLMTPIWLVTDI